MNGKIQQSNDNMRSQSSFCREKDQEEDEKMEENIKMILNMDDDLDNVAKLKSSIFCELSSVSHLPVMLYTFMAYC